MLSFKKIKTWIILLSKRYLKNPLFIATMLAIPIMVVSLRLASGTDEAAARVGVYVENPSGNQLAVDASDYLTGDKNTSILFVSVDSKEEIYESVKSGQFVCGFIFPDNFETALDNYLYGKRDLLPYENGIILSVKSEDSNYSFIANELVFTSFYESFAHKLLYRFMERDKHTAPMSDEDLAFLEEQYQNIRIDGEMFNFTYVNGNESTLLNTNSVSFMLLPIRGIILTLILLASLVGGILLYKDKMNRMFDSIPLKARGIINYLYVLVPACIAGLVGLIGILFSGAAYDFAPELACMFVYVLFVSGITNLIRRLASTHLLFISIIPIFIIANIILCPVFLDFKDFIPGIKYIRLLLPANYGIASINSFSSFVLMGILSIVLFATIIKDNK